MASYKNRQHDGIYVNCYDDGIAWMRGNFINGKRNGRFKYYDEKGQLYAIEEYNNGTLLSTKEVVKKQ